MNNILTLRGQPFTAADRSNNSMSVTLPSGAIVEISKLKNIHQSLIKVREFWKDNKIIDGVLIGVYYNCVVAKSNRIQGYLHGGENKSPLHTVVGAKFNLEKDKHIITHYISRDILDKTIDISKNVIQLFEQLFEDGTIDSKTFNDKLVMDNLSYSQFGIAKTTFKRYVRDAYYVESFDIEMATKDNLNNSIVTFYDVNDDIRHILSKIDIDLSLANILDQTTVLLDEKNVDLVFSKIPYLVSMAVENLSTLSPDDFQSWIDQVEIPIPSPTNEPTIGVIDTLFDDRVYFNEWVEYHDLISEHIPKGPEDYRHGTAVTSLIVDAPNLNPNLDDGCGRFQVRHFGVSLQKGFTSFNIVKQIKEIVSQNTDIKVWNLSLGSNDEVKDNFISPEAAVLDEIQFEYDVIFVIAGTNAKIINEQRKKIGSPADSLNSVIVNSVDLKGNPPDYARKGIVLSFFQKPDIAYYGGGNGDYINVCEPLGSARLAGTSYAAPLIARKLAYLINIMGLRREEAKALLIDSAIAWNSNKRFEERILIGNGIVPIKIQDVLSTSDDEIKFIVSDISDNHKSYNYNFPVPIFDGKYPFVAKATMCYFTQCSRNQGVDYTNTEINLVFGRLRLDNKKDIEPINNDNQHSQDDPGYVREKHARDLFRKWDNVKNISENFTSRTQAKKIFNTQNPSWGMRVTRIERLGIKDREGVRFGVVITLKEINGVNRIDDFIKQASLRGWLVSQLQIDTQVNIYNKLNEEIEFD